MRDDRQPLNEKSRSTLRSGRRKTNIILNSLIVIVVLLIVIVSSKIFFGNDQNDSEETSLVTSANDLVEKDSETASDEKTDTNKEDETNDEEETDDLSNEDSEQNEQEDLEDQEIVTEGGSDPEVKKTIVNPVWEPVGTSQEGQHFNSYSGVDWNEMVQAITYGTGIEESNMIIDFLGNNGPNKSVGTITQKDTQQKFRVYIEWVDQEGWKPTLVEELAN